MVTIPSRLDSLDALRRVFTSLGYEAAAGDDGLIARWRGFRILGVVADDPRGAARHLARQCASAAEPALVAATGAGLLVLAAPPIGHASPRVLTIQLANPDPDASDVLHDLAPAEGSTTLQHALRLRELLTTERAGERFFHALQGVHRRMVASLGTTGSATDRETAAVLTLTRVLFLYFVQAKGWLAGRPRFLREMLDGALAGRRHFHRRVLHPLFFGALNRPQDGRSAGARAFGAIPYLNGGLFEPHPIERRIGPVVFNNLLWRDAFDTCFERFRFTVREAEDIAAIAPDMLGRVFENLMATDRRSLTGTFYTPEPIVRAMVETALDAIGHRPLDPISILDPAVGSGAFLLGALDVLTERRRAAGDGRPVHAVRRAILARSLFGVDVNPLAVRLAELRLWLAVIAEDPATDPGSVRPLPNLDGVVRQGDALLDPLGASRSLGIGTLPDPGAAHRVAEARHALFEARGAARAPAVRALRESETQLARALLDAGSERCRLALAELATIARGRDLFGRRNSLTEPQQRRKRLLRGQLQYLRGARAGLEDGAHPFFSFEVHTADVASRGFDLVIGNPPWVRAERIPAPIRRTLKERFTTWRARGGLGFGHDPDLAVAFVERAIELTAPHGAIAMLLPSKVATAGYGTPLREMLARQTTLQAMHRLTDGDRSFRAAVYPMALVTRRRPPDPGHRAALTLGGTPVLAQARLNGAPWVLIPDRQHEAVARFLQCGEPLGTRVQPSLGLKTGADRIFVGVEDGTQGDCVVVVLDGGERVPIEPAMLRPALRGRDVRPFGGTPSSVILLAYEGNQPIPDPPDRTKRWFLRHARRLSRRADHRNGPPWSVFRTAAAMSPWRVAWSDLARRPQAVLLEAAGLTRVVPLNTCYVAAAPDRLTGLLVSAVLNSTWAAAFISVSADEARGGYRRVNARVVSRLPAPPKGPATDAVVRLAAQAHEGHSIDRLALDEGLADAWRLGQADRAALRGLAQHHG